MKFCCNCEGGFDEGNEYCGILSDEGGSYDCKPNATQQCKDVIAEIAQAYRELPGDEECTNDDIRGFSKFFLTLARKCA